MKATLFVYLFTSLLLFSCGEQAAEEEEVVGNPNTQQWNEPIKAETKIEGEELVIGRRVCESFQKKRIFLAKQARGLVMDFRVSDKSCNQEEPTVERTQGRIQASRSGELSFTNLDPFTPVFQDVLSDQHANLESFCDDILSGKETTNTREKGLVKYQVNFFRTSGVDRDWINIVEFQKQGDKYLPFVIERASVVTERDSQNEDQHGFVSLRAINRPCSNNGTQYIMQEWL